MSSRFARFLVVGGTAAVLNIASRVLFSYVIPFEIAVVLAFPVGMTYAFLMSRLFVFEPSERSVRSQYGRFAVVNLVALAQVWLVSVGLTYWLFPAIGWTIRAELVAHSIAVCSPVLTSYYAHRVFTFGKSEA
jgi:putative flippase GtrA